MQFSSIIKLIRPHQYLKNLFIFLPIFFALKITDISLLLKSLLAFLSFSLAASAIYILNDYLDIEEDKRHPIKKNRPLASGEINSKYAIFMMGFFITLSLIIISFISMQTMYIIILYIILNIAYSYKLKHIAIIDIIVISIGFVLRVFAGTYSTGLDTSMWIIVITFLLALFLALAKRRDDVLLFNKTGAKMRKVIDGYNLQFVDMAMTLMAGVVIVSYLMYCVSPEVIARTGSNKLYITLIFVIVGFMRYMQITYVEENSGSPTKILMKDRIIQISIVMWIITFAILLY